MGERRRIARARSSRRRRKIGEGKRRGCQGGIFGAKGAGRAHLQLRGERVSSELGGERVQDFHLRVTLELGGDGDELDGPSEGDLLRGGRHVWTGRKNLARASVWASADARSAGSLAARTCVGARRTAVGVLFADARMARARALARESVVARVVMARDWIGFETRGLQRVGFTRVKI